MPALPANKEKNNKLIDFLKIQLTANKPRNRRDLTLRKIIAKNIIEMEKYHKK
jgi:hypothetical protein